MNKFWYFSNFYIKAKKEKFRELLEHQRDEYNTILKESEQIFLAYGAKERELGKMVKMNSKMMSEAKLFKKDDDSTIAKMMIEGTMKGIKKLESCISTYNEEDEEAYDLSLKLLDMLKHNIRDLKIYL